MSIESRNEPVPPLSIIVPVLNEAAELPDLLAALSAYRARGCEIILVDGGSSDATVALARRSGFTVIESPRGRARQMNAGAAQSRSAMLLFLHADTRLPECADLAIHAAMRQPAAAWGRFDVRIEGRSWMLPIVAWAINRRSRWSGIATGDQAIFVRSELFRSLGGFADQPLMEDIELCGRLRRIARPLCLRPAVRTSGRRWDRDGAWKTILLMWRLRFAYWRGVPAEQLARRYR